MDFVTKIRSIKLSAYIMRIWDSFYVTVGPHTFKVYSHEGRNTMKKKKLLSYILSTSLLISLTSNPVLAMTGGGANIDQEITSVQENQYNNSNQNKKDQESDSKDISDSKDQDDEPSSDTPDKSEEDSDSGDKESDQDKGSDKSEKGSAADDLNKDHKQDDPESESDKGKDSTDSDKSDKEDDKDPVKEDSSEKKDDVSDSDSTDQEKKDTENEDKTGEKQEDDLETSSGKSDSSSETKKEEEEADPDCAQLEGCVNGKHDKDCPLYEEDVDLLPDLECAHLEGCVGEFHDKDCPLYEETDPEKECQHLAGCVDGKHDPDCPCYKEADPLMLARGVQVSDVIYLDASGDDTNNGTSAETAVQTLEKAYEIAEDGDTIYLLSDIVLHQPTVLTGDKSVTIESASDDETHTITYASATSPKPTDENYMIKIGNEAGTQVQTQVVLANLVIDAKTQDMRCLRVCSGASLTLEDGATVTNGRAISQDADTGCNDWGGGIVVDGNATLTMEDGSEITNCSAEWGGAVYVSGEMVINGGEISNNTAVGDIFKINGANRSASAHGGAIMVRACKADYDNTYNEPAKLIMNGGEIKDNAATADASAFGGAIAILGAPHASNKPNVFEMSGGLISDNHAVDGGAISAYIADNYWQGNVEIQISDDATIEENKVRRSGGAIYLNSNNAGNYTNKLEITGGTISENKAVNSGSKGGGIYLSGQGDLLYLVDGKIENNEAGMGGAISINSSGEKKAKACVLGGTIADNKATDGYPAQDTQPERYYYGNAIDQNGELYLNGISADIRGDIRIKCDAVGSSIFTNRFVTLVGASEDMNDYELSSDQAGSVDGRAVVVPGNVTYDGMDYEVADAEPYVSHFKQNHKRIVTNTDYKNQVPTGTNHEKSLVLYGKHAVEITPMDITSYVGGNGYDGVIGSDGQFATNDLPEIGFYLTLPDELNELLGSTQEEPKDLSDYVALTYNDSSNRTTRDWALQLYGEEDSSLAKVDGQHVYIYKLMSSKINGTAEQIPLRMQFTDEAGNVMVDSKFPVNDTDQFRDYKVDFYSGDLDAKFYNVTVQVNGSTQTYPVILNSGSLKVRGNKDQTYRDISDTMPSVDPQNKGVILAETAQDNTQYFINKSNVNADPVGVKLLVDHSLDDTLLTAYLNQNKNADGKYVYQFRYLDLVDTHNGNAYMTMAGGQKMNIYWPVPEDAKEDSTFHIVHFGGLNRESNADMNDLLRNHIPEELSSEKVFIDGQAFIKFSVGSFSPFALMYENGSTSGNGGNSGNSGTSNGNNGSSGGESSSSGSGSSGGHSSSAGSVTAGTTQQEKPEETNLAENVSAVDNTDEIKEENQVETALPKTGQSDNWSAVLLFNSAILLLFTCFFKKKEH